MKASVSKVMGSRGRNGESDLKPSKRQQTSFLMDSISLIFESTSGVLKLS